MKTELFRMLNVRPPRPATVIVVDDVAGTPPILSALERHAAGRGLTEHALAEAVDAAISTDTAGLDGLDVTELGRSLEDWEPGDDAQALIDMAEAIDLDYPGLQEALASAGDIWTAATISNHVSGGAEVPEESRDRVRHALRGATLARRVAARGAEALTTAELTAIARAPLAIRDTVGVVAGLRSSARSEEFDARRRLSQAEQASIPSPAARLRAVESLERKLIDAHARVASLRRAERASAPSVAPARASQGVLGRVRSWILGDRVIDHPPHAGRHGVIRSEGAGTVFRESLSEEDRLFAEAIWGETYASSVEDFAGAMRALHRYQEAIHYEAPPSGGVIPQAPGTTFPGVQPPQVIAGRPGVRVAGIGDLIVARETHKRYEAEEIAHIENILPLEERVRQHRRVRTSESIFEQESQQETETEQDLRTSDRFELQSESERTIETAFGVDFGVNVTANYGFVNGSITVESDLGISYSRNVTESERNATSISREVVNRSLERLKQRARELRRITLTETVDELNRHAINGLMVPFSGIYKWVNKVQEVELRHFGQRLMLEFYIPEPALRLLRVTDRDELETPPKLDIDPGAIDRRNYMRLARTYEATGVAVPPPAYTIVETAFEVQPEEDRASQGHYWKAAAKESIPLPPGYIPTHAQAVVINTTGSTQWIEAYVAVGGEFIIHDTGNTGSLASGLLPIVGTSIERGQNGVAVAYSIATNFYPGKRAGGAIHLLILCERTTEAWQAWQIDTFQKFHEGNQRQWSAYREALLSQVAASGVSISGRNPLENRAIERDELKRWSIELMRGQPFDINGIDETGPTPGVAYDRIDGNRNINVFFERAFEWTQMTYWFYPYFWGRREHWEERLGLESADPLHQQFLRAGSARALVPVTPGFEERVLHYLGSLISQEDQSVSWTPDLDAQGVNPAAGIPAQVANPDIWMEVILNKNKELAYGTGTLTVQNGSTNVKINPDSSWTLDDTDLGRELYIEGFPYTLTALAGPKDFVIDKAYEQSDNAMAHYLVSSVRVGAPWEVVIPTNLVVLADQADKLNLGGPVNVIDPADIVNRSASGTSP